MGIFSKPKPPAVANYQTVAGQQTAANTATTNQLFGLNAVDQTNPYGSLSYSMGPDGTYSASQQLSPQQQQLLDYLQGTQATAGNAAGGLLSSANYQNPADFGDMESGLVGQRLDAFDQYNQPYFDKQRDALDTRLRNQGLVPGGRSHDYQTMELEDNQFRRRSEALAQFEPQAFQQAVQQYQMPAQMATSLAGFGSPNSVIQNLWNTPQAQGNFTDVIGANANMNQANMAAYEQQMKNRAATIGAIGSIAGGALLGPMGGPMMGMLGGMGSSALGMLGLPGGSTNLGNSSGWDTRVNYGR